MKELRYAVLMRASTNKQTAAGKAKKAKKGGKEMPLTMKEDITNTIPEQKKNIMRFIESQPEESKGIKWVDSGLEFVEAGVSGFHTHTSKRKGLQDAYEAAKNNEYDVLVIYKLDRFGRRSVESLDMAIKFLRFCRIWVVDKAVEFKNSGEQDEILNFIEFWSAKKSSQDTKKRVTDAMQNIHEKGFWTGGNPPYGFENNPDIYYMLRQIPEEVKVVKEIYDLYVNHGYGYLKISSHLNEKGIRSKTDKNWSSHTVRKILLNTVYMGHLSYGKTKHVEGEFGTYQKSLKNGEGTVSEKYWEEYDIVGADMWEKAQDIKKKRVKPNAWGGKSPSNKASGKGLLVGILKCECGGHMTYSTCSDWVDSKRTAKKEPYGIYRCQTRLKQGVAACGAKKATWRVEEYDAKVVKRLAEYTSKLVQEKQIEKIREKTEAATESIKEKIDIVKADITRHKKTQEFANKEMKKIINQEEADLSMKQASQLFEDAEKELERLEKELVEYEGLKSTDNMNEVDMKKLEHYILEWEFIFNHGTPVQKRNLIHSIANEVVVTKEQLKISTDMDIPKFFEFITAIKNSAKTEIAASLEQQAVEASASSLSSNDSRSTDSTQITGMETVASLLSMDSRDSYRTQSTEMKNMIQKLSKAFGSKLKNQIISAS